MHVADENSKFTELVSFIRDIIGEYEMIITRETAIESDLGVSGDEAGRLVVTLSKKYGFSIENFRFSRYFNDEPSFFCNSRNVQPFTVGHIEKAILAGRLDEEVINS